MVRNYMLKIIRGHMANERGINPADVDMSEVVEIYKNDNLDKYKIKEIEITRYENDKEIKLIACGLVDRNTGYEYYGNVIEISNSTNIK